MGKNQAKSVKFSATISRDGFGSEYDDNDAAQREIAEAAYERAAVNVMSKRYPGARVTTDIDFRPVGLRDSALVTVDGNEVIDGNDPNCDYERGLVWDEMCATTWGEVYNERN